MGLSLNTAKIMKSFLTNATFVKMFCFLSVIVFSWTNHWMNDTWVFQNMTTTDVLSNLFMNEVKHVILNRMKRKAILRDSLPGPTFNFFASMPEEKFEGLPWPQI